MGEYRVDKLPCGQTLKGRTKLYDTNHWNQTFLQAQGTIKETVTLHRSFKNNFYPNLLRK